MPVFVLFATLLVLAAPGCASSDGDLDSQSGPAPATTETARPEATPSPVPATPVAPPAPGNPGQDVRNLPWNRDLVLYRSNDGVKFTAAGTFVERAGVPNVIRDASGRLVAVFQWFPFEDRAAFDRVAVAFSSDDGQTWTKPVQMVIAGMPESLMRPFDPTVVQLGDGRYRLYFTSNERGAGSKPAIYSAIGNDGVNYQFEPGTRFAPAAGTVDCSVVFFKGSWHLYSHNQQANTGNGYHAVSEDGLAFTQRPDVAIGTGKQWIGNALVFGQTLRYFGSGRDGLWWAASADGANWELAAAPGISAGDPSAVVLGSGGLLLIAVGDVRADAGPRPN